MWLPENLNHAIAIGAFVALSVMFIVVLIPSEWPREKGTGIW